MLTKIGTELVSTTLAALGPTSLALIAPKAMAFTGINGTYNAYKLSKQEKDALRKHYRLPEDSNILLRSTGRGILGGGLGALGGYGAWKLMQAAGLLDDPMNSGMALGGLLAGGAAFGNTFFADKYSKNNAARIMLQDLRKNQNKVTSNDN